MDRRIGKLAVVVGVVVALTSTAAKGQPAQASNRLVVHFALGRSDLTPQERSIVVHAASEIISSAAGRVLVVGHADSSGEPEDNLSLSMRRAQTVSRTLQQSGAPAAVIESDWKGEFDPAVPTGPNEPLPENRRVTIDIFP